MRSIRVQQTLKHGFHRQHLRIFMRFFTDFICSAPMSIHKRRRGEMERCRKAASASMSASSITTSSSGSEHLIVFELCGAVNLTCLTC